MSERAMVGERLTEFEQLHGSLLRAGLAFVDGDLDQAAGELDDLVVVASDVAADLRAAAAERTTG